MPPNHPSWRDPLDPNTLYCPCGHVRAIALVRSEVEAKLPRESDHEVIETAQARFVCKMCGYGEVYQRDHREHREAAEAERRGETLLRGGPGASAE